MKILLTGAGGFVGQHLLSQLKQQNHFVRAIARTSRISLEQADETVIETLSPLSDFTTHLGEIETVVHLADGFNAFENLPATAKNDEASERLATTIALAQAAAQAKVRFVYLSTTKTMSGTYANEVLREDMAPCPQSLYAVLKVQAEKAILAMSQEQGSKAVILRFPVVFGPDVGGNMQKLLALADTSLPLPFKEIENQRSLISSDSLIGAVMTIIERANAGEGLFLVHDESISSARLIALLRQGLARPSRLFAPPSLFWSVANSVPGVRAKLDRFTRSLELDDTRFRATFDWQPSKSLDTLLMEFAAESKRKS